VSWNVWCAILFYLAIKFKLTADSERPNDPRVFIDDSNVHEFTLNSQTSTTNCYEVQEMYLIFAPDGSIAEYPDIKFTVTHEIPYGDGVSKPNRSDIVVPSLDSYPILSQTFQDGKNGGSSLESTTVWN